MLKDHEKAAYISRFAVADSLRKTGLGLKLMDAALDLPECKDCGIVLLHTAVSNKNMCEFYANRGFVLVDSETSRGYRRGLFARVL